MVELYRVQYRIGTSMPTGTYEITRRGTRREVTKYAELYKTDLGDLTPEEWRRGLSKAIETDRETDVLELIVAHCRQHCAWLRKEEEIRDYAMEVLAGRSFLCGNECWEDVGGKVRDKYFLFTFEESGFSEGQRQGGGG